MEASGGSDGHDGGDSEEEEVKEEASGRRVQLPPLWSDSDKCWAMARQRYHTMNRDRFKKVMGSRVSLSAVRSPNPGSAKTSNTGGD